jgi:hypothetical protein
MTGYRLRQLAWSGGARWSLELLARFLTIARTFDTAEQVSYFPAIKYSNSSMEPSSGSIQKVL